MKPTAVVCSGCGQRGDRPPGLRLDEFPDLEAVFVGNQALIGDRLPQRLTCRACGKTVAVPHGSIEVRKNTDP